MKNVNEFLSHNLTLKRKFEISLINSLNLPTSPPPPTKNKIKIKLNATYIKQNFLKAKSLIIIFFNTGGIPKMLELPLFINVVAYDFSSQLECTSSCTPNSNRRPLVETLRHGKGSNDSHE